MARHPNQTNGYNRPLGPSNPKPPTPRMAYHLARAKGKLLDATPLPLKPPLHVCDYGEASGRCRRCGRERA